MVSTRLRVAAAAAFAAISAYTASAAVAADQVTALPGWTQPLLSKLYSGYLNIPGGKHLHYTFIESQNQPSSDPVVAFFNGGPGCSSMEGMFAELGPYLVQPDLSLSRNMYTWNNISNLLFIEAPAGVGFSYADTPAGLVHNDSTTATDNLNALLQFFGSYPEFKGNDFYITGESYAGVYVPMLAYDVVQFNKQAGKAALNLKGIMVGNGCLGSEVGVCGSDPMANFYNLEQWRGHGLVSFETYLGAMSACGNWYNPGPNCNAAMQTAANEVGAINVYDIYSTCNYPLGSKQRRVATLEELDTAASSIRAGKVLSSPMEHRLRRPVTKIDRMLGLHVGGPDECIETNDLTEYMAQASVVKALHVTPNIPWVMCTGNFSYTSTMADERQVIYPTLIQGAKLRVLIFNGEADACVPFTDNEAWTSSMNYTIVAPWRAWMADAADVGGYVTQYAYNFTFATVRGSGHMVPEYRPYEAWIMFDKYLNQKAW